MNTVQRTRTSVHAEQPLEQNSRSAIMNIRSAFMGSSTHGLNTVQIYRTPEQNAEHQTAFSERQTPFMASPGSQQANGRALTIVAKYVMQTER